MPGVVAKADVSSSSLTSISDLSMIANKCKYWTFACKVFADCTVMDDTVGVSQTFSVFISPTFAWYWMVRRPILFIQMSGEVGAGGSVECPF